MKVTEEIFKKAEKEGSAREFLFALLKEMKGGNLSRRDFKTLNHEEIILRIVKENNLEPYFSLSGSKNIYNALRKAFRSYFRAKVEKEWTHKIENWRKELEVLLSKAIADYLVEAGSVSRVRQLVTLGWIVPPYAVRAYRGGRPFDSFKDFLKEHYLRERFNSYKNLGFLTFRYHILEEILQTFFSGFLELSIYGLFVQIEGVVWEIFVKNNPLESDIESLIRKRNRKFITIQYALKLITENLTGDGRVPQVFDWVKFVDFEDDGRLNRNAVMHGISVKFGSKENFLRLFLLFDFLIYIGSRLQNGCCTK
ncbi:MULTISPECIES: hypothetical protein [unclassified Desulfurobacterium]|uniref:hypothetical protein n=1 Tax=Desulfurobacterium sp. TC5-1 TaxID=1158318 RepID=UPI0003B2E890|nr:hypothetical protein [Desulfurobacterium sp. TC5-1]